jgi:hypothetical protein
MEKEGDREGFGDLKEGNLRLPFHHEEEDGSISDMRGHLISVTGGGARLSASQESEKGAKGERRCCLAAGPAARRWPWLHTRGPRSTAL